nr:hypothetical protein GCM10020092_009350 [Actinoplanes digitatis]
MPLTGEIHDPDPVRVRGEQLLGDDVRQPGLAGATRTGDGDEPVPADQIAQLGQLRLGARRTG